MKRVTTSKKNALSKTSKNGLGKSRAKRENILQEIEEGHLHDIRKPEPTIKNRELEITRMHNLPKKRKPISRG